MKFLLLLLLSILSGCSFIESEAGKANYSYTRTDPDGTKHEIVLKNAKNIGELLANVESNGLSVTLEEKGVDAVGPMQAIAEQQKITNQIIQSLLLQSKP